MSANPWFRMYHEFATDPKVQMLSEADQRRFVMLLCMRCCNGDVTLQDDAVAFHMRISAEEWAATKARLRDRNLIDDGNKPVAWERRQYASDSSRNRVAKHREKKRNGDMKRYSNGTDTESDTDTDAEDNTNVRTEAAREKSDGRTPIQSDLKKAFNGSTEMMLVAVENAMGGNCRPNAEQWLASTMSAHGAQAVAQAYAAIVEKQASGVVVARFLPHWSSVAAGMKAGRPSPQNGAPGRDNRPAWAVEKDARRAAFMGALRKLEGART